MVKKTLLILILISFFNCERDDVCLDATTPKLIIRFVDALDETKTKEVPNLKVMIDSLGVDIVITPISNDSIIIPLRVDVDLTKIKISKTETEVGSLEIIDEFTLNYIRNEVFVSRSCGYKTDYLEVEEEGLTIGWITRLDINNQNITDEKARHISIIH